VTTHQNFKDAITAIKNQAAQAVIDTIEDSPKAALGHINEATTQVFGEMTANDKLRLMAQIENVGELGMDFRYFDEYGDFEDAIDAMFNRCVDHHLDDFRSGIASSAFAVGFLPAALALVELAEGSGGSKWIRAEHIEAARAAYDHLAASEGHVNDLDAVFDGIYLFDRLMSSPKDRVLHGRHNTTMDEMRTVVREVKFYRDLLGPGRSLAPGALETLATRQRNLPIIEAEHARLKAARARLGR
jgi:hypothetical protein